MHGWTHLTNSILNITSLYIYNIINIIYKYIHIWVCWGILCSAAPNFMMIVHDLFISHESTTWQSLIGNLVLHNPNQHPKLSLSTLKVKDSSNRVDVQIQMAKKTSNGKVSFFLTFAGVFFWGPLWGFLEAPPVPPGQDAPWPSGWMVWKQLWRGRRSSPSVERSGDGDIPWENRHGWHGKPRKDRC